MTKPMNKKVLRKKIDILNTEMQTHYTEAAFARKELIQGKLYYLVVLLLPSVIGVLAGRKIKMSLMRFNTRILRYAMRIFSGYF